MKTTSTSNILTKALLNGFIGWLVFALVVCLKHGDANFAQALVAPMSIYIGIASAVGSYVGYVIRENRAKG